MADDKRLEFATASPAYNVEDAVSHIGFGRFHWALLLMAGMCSGSAVMEIVSPSYLIPSAACDFNMTATEKSILGSIAFIGMVAGTHFWGLIGDLRGRVVVLRTSLLCDAIVALLSSLLPSYTFFTIARFFNGFFIGAPTSCSMAYLGEFHTERTRGRALVLMAAFPGSMTLVLAGLAYVVLPLNFSLPIPWLTFHSWRLFVIINALPSLLTGLSCLWFPESPRYLAANGRSDEALQVLRRVYVINTGNSPDTFPVGGIIVQNVDERTKKNLLSTIWSQTAPILQLPFVKDTLLLCVLMYAVIASANGFMIWLPEIFNRMSLYEEAYPNSSFLVCQAVQNMSLQPILLVEDPQDCILPDFKKEMFINTAFIGLSNVIVPFLSVPLVNFFGKRLLLSASLLTSGLCGVFITITGSSSVVLALACGQVAISSMCVSVVASISVEQYPTTLRAMAVSLILMTGRLGSMSGSFLFGLLLESRCIAAFAALSGMLLVCSALTLLLPKKGQYAT